MTATAAPLEIAFTLECSPPHAFEVWAQRTSLWWPHSHSWSGEPGLEVRFEPREGGRIYERAADGTEHDWGEVVAWEPPHRLVYLWHLMFDRADATEVEVSFAPEAEAATTVTIVHRGWERLGAEGPVRLERNRQGWDGVTGPYRQACAAAAP